MHICYYIENQHSYNTYLYKNYLPRLKQQQNILIIIYKQLDITIVLIILFTFNKLILIMYLTKTLQ